MNKILKILVGILVGIFLLLLVLPIVFKGKVEQIIKDEINNQVNAKVDYNAFSLSLIKNFPNVNMGIDGLFVVGNDNFSKDTLVYLGSFSTELDLISAISGCVEIKSVLLKDLLVNAIVLPDSSANWDIFITHDEIEVEEQSDTEPSDFRVLLESFVIDNANILYHDQTINLESAIKGFNLELSGDMSEVKTNLQITSVVDQAFVTYEDIKYVNGTSLALNARIGADLENMVFSLLENELRLNRMSLKMDGEVDVKENGYGLNLKLGTTNTDLKSLLALVPETYLKDIEDLKTEGVMSLVVEVKGDYIDEAHLPAFDFKLLVDKGMIKYPELPQSIDNINVKLKVNNEGGSADKTFVILEQFHFELDNNPFDATLTVGTPISNAVFNGKVDGRIDLGSLREAVPLDSFDIKGIVEANLAINGDYKMVENEDYESINAKGSLALSNFAFKNQDLPQGILINHSKMTFNPRSVKLEAFDCKIGASDFQLNGILENYLSYALKNGVLRGQLNHYSKLINSNELMVQASSEISATEGEEEDIALVEVPKDIDFTLNTKIDKLLYDKLAINKAEGKVTIRDGVVKMDGLKMQLLDGSMLMSGQYNTKNSNKAFVDFNIEGQNLDLNRAANSFSVVDSMLPLAKNTKGRISPKFIYYSQLSKNAKPIMATTNGGGWLKSESIEVSGSKIQNSLASTLKKDSYKKMKAEDLNINFVIENGNIIVKPFKTKVGGQLVEVQGTQGLDQSLNYKITMPVSRKEVAKMAGLVGFNLPTSGDDLMVDVLVTGTVQEPLMRFDLDKAQKQVAKDLEKEGEKLLKNFLKGF